MSKATSGVNVKLMRLLPDEPCLPAGGVVLGVTGFAGRFCAGITGSFQASTRYEHQ